MLVTYFSKQVFIKFKILILILIYYFNIIFNSVYSLKLSLRQNSWSLSAIIAKSRIRSVNEKNGEAFERHSEQTRNFMAKTKPCIKNFLTLSCESYQEKVRHEKPN